MKRLISGIKPTGRLHIGNYFGAMRQFVDLQNSGDYDCSFFIADLHALTTVNDSETLRNNSLEIAMDYMAIGLDPKKSLIFLQSDIQSVTEVCWIFDCLTTMPYLMRAHAYKDAEARNKEINVGVFNYPMLMAADILLNEAEIVPVGNDQRQHVEIARDTADKFNRLYGGGQEIFKRPSELVLEEVATIVGTDGQKMSKSYGNTIPLFASDDEIRKAVMSIPTDSSSVSESKNPDDSIVFKIHSLLLDKNETNILREKFLRGGVGYKDLKEDLIRDLTNFIAPIRDRRAKIAANSKQIKKILERAGRTANKRAKSVMNRVRMAVGLR